MKTTLVAAALAGSATAHIAAHLARRDGVLGGVRPEEIEGLPEDCRTAVQSLVSAVPAEPTVFVEFSSAYYESNSRTATATTEDCAWITELPGSAQTAYVQYSGQLTSWLMDSDQLPLVMDVEAKCGGLQPEGDVPCLEEWSDFAFEAMQGYGSDPSTATESSLTSASTPASTSASETASATGSSKSTGTEGPAPTGTSGEGNAASAMAVRTYAVASILAAFVGAVALI